MILTCSDMEGGGSVITSQLEFYAFSSHTLSRRTWCLLFRGPVRLTLRGVDAHGTRKPVDSITFRPSLCIGIVFGFHT